MKNIICIIFLLCLSAMVQVSIAAVLKVPSNYSTIQSAIDAAQRGDTVLLARGSYAENIIFGGKSIVLASNYVYSYDQHDIDETKISGDSNSTSSVIYIGRGTTNQAKLMGFTIERSSTVNIPFIGGAIYCGGSSPTFSRLKIINSRASETGGGMAFSYSESVLDSLYVGANKSNGNGGGFFAEFSKLSIRSCSFIGNEARVGGAAYIYNVNDPAELSNPVIDNCTFMLNKATSGGESSKGGAICSISGSTKIIASTFIRNSTTGQAGAIYLDHPRFPYLINLTIAHNSIELPGAGNLAAGVFINNTSASTYCDATIKNSIFWSNAVAGQYEMIITGASGTNKAQMSYSDVDVSKILTEGNATVENGSGIINADPLIISPYGLDFGIGASSPCIDKGDPDTNEDGKSWEEDEADRDADYSRKDIGAIPYLDPTPVFTSNFTFVQTDEYAPSLVLFTDKSKVMNLPAITGWAWDFNNDGVADSNEKNPTYSYTKPGTYTVRLTVSNGTNSDTKIITGAITVLDVGEGYYTVLTSLPMTQTLVAGQLTGYQENEVPFTIAKAIYPDLTEWEQEASFNSTGNEYWGHPARFDFDLSGLGGEVVEVSALVADNYGSTLLALYNGSNVITTVSINSNASDYNQYKWVKIKPNVNPSKVVFSSFEGVISEMRIKVKKAIPNPVLDINMYAQTCRMFNLSASLLDAPQGDISYMWFIDGVQVSTEPFFSQNFEVGEHSVCLKSFISDDLTTPFAEKCKTIFADEIKATYTYTIYPTEKRIELAGKVMSEGQISYRWDFGDGEYYEGGLLASHTYTSNGTYYPTFVATLPGNMNCFGNYSEEIVIADVAGGNDCMNNSIVGVVNVGLVPVNLSAFKVELYKTTENAQLTLYATGDINAQTGDFTFGELSEGIYIVRAKVVNSQNYPQALVTYFNGVMDQVVAWQQASPIVLTCNSKASINLTLAAITEVLNGNGSISGLVTYSNAKRSQGIVASTVVGDRGFAAARICLMNKATGKVIAQVFSESDGKYAFANLPVGSYEVVVDIPGVSMVSSHSVELTAENSSASSRNFIVNLTSGITAASTFKVLYGVPNGNGTLSAMVGGGVLSSGSEVEPGNDVAFVAVPSANYRVKGWVYNGVTMTNNTTVNFTLPSIQQAADVAVEFESVTGVDKEADVAVAVYPNPFADKLVLWNAQCVSKVALSNVVGATVLVMENQGEDRLIVDASTLRPGIYLLSIHMNNGNSSVRKVVKR